MVRLLLFSLGLLVLALPVARAAPFYNYAFDRTSYAASAGATVDAEVFLEEHLAAGDTSRLQSENGLASAAVKLSYQGLKPSSPARVVSKNDIFANPLFNDSQSPEKYLSADILAEDPEAIDPMAALSEWVSVAPPAPGGVLPEVVTPGQLNRLSLGTFRVTLGNTVGEMTAIEASKLFSELDLTVTYGSSALEVASATATFLATPEPAALGLGLLGATALALFRRKARRDPPAQ
jgi:hypothetical protein